MIYEGCGLFCVALSGLFGRGGSGFSFSQDFRPGLLCVALAGLNKNHPQAVLEAATRRFCLME